ncbi:hypothetical protein G6O69_06045 [Pseudenhygromyxa sp. WMMC2535]|uniref:hypothetical protein n=1 Tax=Pseudenhygromyxa sp. WMMC2535 TaxID=2712867 RepID=UPI001555EA02|nr:hypothetical protein [Pseudenhygromyxa sp. WMMC2535]NVB37385.1 hypothetical protein [Pseudenhygromyxa sp. WMMC2535]
MTTSEPSAQQLARELLGPAWPRVRRISLIRREIRESLSTSALEILLEAAELIVEGDRDLEAGAEGESLRGYATVMLSIDLARAAALLREPADDATAERVAELMRGSRTVRGRVIELARPQLAALFECPERSLRVELQPVIRAQGSRILLDADAVVSLGSAQRRSSAGGRR